MSSDTGPSKRNKRAVARQGAALQRMRPGWNPATHTTETEEERLRAEARLEAANAISERTANCEACARLRQELGDPSALCDTHFAALLGM